MRGKLTRVLAVRCLVAVGAVCLLCAAERPDGDRTWELDIPGQTVGAALTALAKQTGTQLLFPYDEVGSQEANPIAGRYTLDRALEIMLRGTGLRGDVTGSGVITVSRSGTSEDGGGDGMKAEQRNGLGALLASIFLTPAASGQDGPSAAQPLEEIIVTATKRSQSLRDVPIAMSAIDSEDILARGLTEYSDYLNSVPGVYFQDAGPGQSQIRIRGIVANEAGGSTSTVATYFGETVTSVLTISGGKPNLRLVDIERVEVLRGPQGTLFGANSLAGVVRIVPALPNLAEFEADVGVRGFSTAHSGDASYHLEGVLNLPLVEDRLAFRLAAYEDEMAGYIDNVVPAQDPLDYSFLADALAGLPPGTTPAGTLVISGNPAFARDDVNSEDTWGVRASLRWQATDRLRFDLSQTVQDVTLNSQPHVNPTAGSYQQRRAMDFVAPAMNSERIGITSLVGTYDWEAVSLVSASSYTNLESAYRDDASIFVEQSFGVPIPWEDQTNSEGNVFTQEVRLQSQGGGPWQWLAGLFYLDQESDVSQTLIDHSCPTCLPTLLFGQDFALRTVGNPRLVNQEQQSVFGELSYRFSPNWTLGFGGRYLEEDIERLELAIEGFLVGGSMPAGDPQSGSSQEFNPSAFLRFEPSDGATFYLQAARGFRSPQTNMALAYTGSCEAEAEAVGLGPLTDPDTLWNYEVGMKTRLADGRVDLSTAVYRQQWEGVQVPVQFLCGSGGTINGGDVSGVGAELELTASLGEAWRLNLAGSHTRNEFDEVKPDIGFEVGDRLPGSPETNASAGLQYDFTVNADWTGFARADYTYVGSTDYQFGQIDPRVVTLDAYDVANLRVGLQRGNLALEIFGRNAFDERAVGYIVDPAQGDRQYLIRPREIGIEVRYGFGQRTN